MGISNGVLKVMLLRAEDRLEHRPGISNGVLKDGLYVSWDVHRHRRLHLQRSIESETHGEKNEKFWKICISNGVLKVMPFSTMIHADAGTASPTEY